MVKNMNEKPYIVFTLKLMVDNDYFEEESDNLIEFIKRLKHTDILEFDYNNYTNQIKSEVEE